VADRASRPVRAFCLALATAALAVMLAACGGSPAPSVFHGSRLGTPWQVPATELTDTHGDAWSFTKDDTAPLTLVFFGYTNCPDVCSQEMADITSALVRITPEQRKSVRVVFVTTDPARDSPAVLTRYLAAFDASYTGLTGTPTALAAVTKAFYVYAAKGQAAMKDGKGYLVEHDDHTFAVTPDHEVVALWKRETTSAQLAEDISALLKEKS
jgi:protein SCO1/2